MEESGIDKEINDSFKRYIDKAIDKVVNSKTLLDIINTKMSEDARLTYIGMLENEMPHIKYEIASIAYFQFKEMILHDEGFLRSLSDRLFYSYDGMIRKALEEDHNRLNKLSGKSQEMNDHLMYIDKIGMCKMKSRIEDDEVL